jgi:hypothetical protein
MQHRVTLGFFDFVYNGMINTSNTMRDKYTKNTPRPNYKDALRQELVAP